MEVFVLYALYVVIATIVSAAILKRVPYFPLKFPDALPATPLPVGSSSGDYF